MLEFVTGRFYSADEDQVIKAIKANIPSRIEGDEAEPCVIFVDKVRQISGVILWGELTEEGVMYGYDHGYYRDATTAEIALVK